MDNIILDQIQIERHLVIYDFHITDGLRPYYNQTSLFIDYPEDMSEVPTSILTIPFVSCMIGLSWLTKATVWVDELDETFYVAYQRIKTAFQDIHPDFQLYGQLKPSRIINNHIQESKQALLLFGGGIDCQSTFLRHSKTISSILNINGWLGSVNAEDAVDVSDKEKTEAFAKRFGKTAYHVRSNFASIFNISHIDKTYRKKWHDSFWHGLLHPMAFISISIPICYLNNISTIYIASSFTKGQNNYCASDVTTDSEYKFAVNGKTIHDGFELNRQEKVKIIVDYQRSIQEPYPLQVCSFNDHNCCECEKCFRTIIALVAEGANPHDYGFEYPGNLTEYMSDVMERKLALWGISHEQKYHWVYTIERMKENYNHVYDQTFVDWFLSYDFSNAKKEGLYKYYKRNFYQILLRKLGW